MDNNLQSANMQEAADPVETTVEAVEEPVNAVDESTDNGVNEQEPAEPVVQSPEVNAQYAAARRRAEEEAQNRINGEFRRLFGNVVNPATGKKIETYQDYLQAVEHQQRAAQNQMLEEKGIDPALIEQMINNSPAMRQAQQVLEENNRAEARRRLEEDVKIVSQIAPDIKSLADLEKHASYPTVLEYVQQRNLSLPDAFKLANFDVLSAKSTEAARQAAINQARAKSHMQTTADGISQADGLMDIPASEINKWKAFFPDASMKELREKYNRVNKN